MGLETTLKTIVRQAEEVFFTFPSVTKISIRSRERDGRDAYYLEVGVVDGAHEQRLLEDSHQSVLSIAEFNAKDCGEEFSNLPIEYVQTGKIRALSTAPVEVEKIDQRVLYTGRARPAAGGDSIGNARFNYAGTLGLLVGDGKKFYILSNWHVLVYGSGAQNDSILQPARPDGGVPPSDSLKKPRPGDEIAKLSSWTLDEHMDMALAEVKKPGEDSVFPGTQDFGVSGPIKPALNMKVKKCGRTSNTTEGMIVSVSATVSCEGPWGGYRTFRDQIETTLMTQTGDSGAVLVATDSHNAITGLLFSNSDNRSYANKVSYFMDLQAEVLDKDTVFRSKFVPRIGVVGEKLEVLW